MALVVVAHGGEHAGALAGQQLHQPVLAHVGVLVLVDQQVAHAVLPARGTSSRRRPATARECGSGRRSPPPDRRPAWRRSCGRHCRLRFPAGVRAACAASSGSISAFFHSEMMRSARGAAAPLSVVASSSWMMLMASSASRIEKVGLSLGIARFLAQHLHAQRMEGAGWSGPDSLRSTSVLTRSSISRAALLVKVSATTLRPM